MKPIFLMLEIVLTIIPVLVYAQQVRQPAASAEEIQPVPVGAKIPSVTLTASDGSRFDLDSATAQKPTILIFYRGGWCPYCNTQLGQLQTVEPELLKLGYQILAISVDRPEKLNETYEKRQLNYTLLSDSSMECALQFGLAYRVDEKTVEKYKNYSMDLEKASGEKHHLLPVPAAFVVGTDRIIKFEFVNPNYKVRVDPDVLLNEARAVLR